MTQPTNIVIAGVGGQGTVLASKLLAQAALLEGCMVRTDETIGKDRRGGSVLGHVRIAKDPASKDTKRGIGWSTLRNLTRRFRRDEEQDVSQGAPLSPLVPRATASLLIGFEPGETVRALDYVRHGGTVVSATQALEPVTATLSSASYDGTDELAYLRNCEKSGRIGRLVLVDGAKLCAELGTTRILNVILLGAAFSTDSLAVSAAALEKAIETLVKPQYIQLNRTALARGMGGTS
jgi:indolepyruvate ferredoxin oxidoreductase beta subunit